MPKKISIKAHCRLARERLRRPRFPTNRSLRRAQARRRERAQRKARVAARLAANTRLVRA